MKKQSKQEKQVFRRLSDGSHKILVNPERKWEWHKPSPQIPTIQWQPDTEMSRYDWARSHTPENQILFWNEFRREFIERSPLQHPPSDLFADLEEKARELKCGLDNFGKEISERLAPFMFYKRSPCNQWSFSIGTEGKGGAVFEIITVAARDYRTLPDWALLMRTRAWLFDDARAVFMFLPDSPPGKFAIYSNERHNALWLLSERPPTPSEEG